MTSRSAPVEDARARVHGLTALVAGEGSSVLFVHGALGDYRQWSPICDRLRPRHTTVAISRRYHWPNNALSPEVEYTYEGHRDDLLHYVRACAGPVHLVGHSYGAGVALLAALAAPEAFRTLTLIEPALHSLLPAEAPGLSKELASRGEMRTEVLRLVEQGDDAGAAQAMIDWTQGGRGGFSRLSAEAQQVLLQNAPTVGPTFSRAAPQVPAQDVARLPMPALVMHGARTRLYYRLIAETVAASAPHARAVDIDGAGHMSIVERPDAVAAVIAEFVAAVEAGR
jgi:pimeloyl-ACP methyl ester carboxylesterase